MKKNGWLKTGGGLLSIIVAVGAILTYLGVLPWATRAELIDHKNSVETHMKRIEKQVDDIHAVFYPRSKPIRRE